MKLAMRIRVARQYANLSQAGLAEKLGVSRGAVANWEGARGVNPATARLERVAVLTHVSHEWLAAGEFALGRFGLKDGFHAELKVARYENA